MELFKTLFPLITFLIACYAMLRARGAVTIARGAVSNVGIVRDDAATKQAVKEFYPRLDFLEHCQKFRTKKKFDAETEWLRGLMEKAPLDNSTIFPHGVPYRYPLTVCDYAKKLRQHLDHGKKQGFVKEEEPTDGFRKTSGSRQG